MAITRAQQYRQMLKEGSMKPVMQGGGPNYLGKQKEVTTPKKWKSSPEHPDTELAYITEPEKEVLIALNMHGGLEDGKPNKGPNGIMSLQGDLGGYDASPGGPDSEKGDGSTGKNDKARAADIMTGKRNVSSPTGDTEGYTGPDPTGRNKTGDFVYNPTAFDKAKAFYNKLPTPFNIAKKVLNKLGPFNNKDFFNQKVLTSKNIQDYDEDDYDEYMTARMAGEIDAYGNEINSSGGEGNGDSGMSDYERRLLALEQATASSFATPEVEKEDEIINYRLMADGGMTNDAPVYEGGIMDLESSRQMYGLGKLVKKITRGVKKIAKSPIGKAALLYAGGTYLGGLKAFGGAGFGSGNFLTNLGSGQGIGNLVNFGRNKLFGELVMSGNKAKGAGYIKKGLLSNKALMGIGIPTALSYFMTPEEEEEQKLASYGADIDDPRYIMNNPSLYTNRRLAAEGGSMDEPVAKKTMPLLDMDGQEMDLREEGGFVPLGRMERADDVPARLSKNEFVFTADAVRNAGEGDVDKGAEVMYNMMKNLESGGDVSEESQGLEGAREMFQTSQRLEEVI